MKKWTFLLAFFMVAKPALPFLEYAVCYEYIASELCINKEIPVIGCNGKCYLMKELSRSSDNENQSQQKKTGQVELVTLYLSPETNYDITNVVPVATIRRLIYPYHNLYSRLADTSIFRPPAEA